MPEIQDFLISNSKHAVRPALEPHLWVSRFVRYSPILHLITRHARWRNPPSRCGRQRQRPEPEAGAGDPPAAVMERFDVTKKDTDKFKDNIGAWCADIATCGNDSYAPKLTNAFTVSQVEEALVE